MRTMFISSILLIFLVSCDDNSTNPPISGDPTVTIISPTNNSLVSDYVEIIAEASDDEGIAKIEFYVDAARISTDAAPPYSAIWNTRFVDHGSNHTIYAVAYDTDNNSYGSKTIVCTIDTSLGTPQAPTLNPITNFSDSSVELFWSRNNDPDFYQYAVIYDTATGVTPSLFSEIVSTSASDTTAVLFGLKDNISYKFVIEVTDLFEKQSISNIVETKTTNSAPPTPIIFSATKLTDRVSISWKAINIWDFYSYEIFLSTDSLLDSGDQLLTTIFEIETIQYDYFISDTVSYYFFLVVNDNSDLSSVSNYALSGAKVDNFCLSFNGSTYATVPYFSGLNLGDKYTLEAWVFQTGAGQYDRVIDKSPTGSPYLQYSLISGTQMGADICNGTSGPVRVHANTGVTLNEWHHLALTYDNGFITYYIDGQQVDTDATGVNSACSFSTTLNIGRRKLFNEFYFRGKIDEVRLWNVVRTASELFSAYNIHFSGNQTGLVSYFAFDEGSGNLISSPVGSDGYLGENAGSDSRDPSWTTSDVPIAY